MQATDSELREIVESLHLKEVVLCEMAHDFQHRLEDIKVLRERIEKEIGAYARAARKE